MKIVELLGGPERAGNIVAYSPRLAQALGGVKQSVLLCQLIFWCDKGRDPSGWIYKTAEEIEEETGLSYKEQRAARAALVKHGVLLERYARLEHKLCFRIDLDEVKALFASFSEMTKSKLPKCPLGSSGTAQIVTGELPKMPFGTTESTNKEYSTEDADADASLKRASSSSARKTSQRKPRQNEPATPEQLEDEPLFEPLCHVCNLRYGNLGPKNRRKFETALHNLQAAGATAKALEQFGKNWKWFWRCEQNGGRAPSPAEVLECWQEVMKLAHLTP